MKAINILEDIFTNQISVLSISVSTKETTLARAKKICTDKNFDVHLVRDKLQNDLRLYEKATGQVRVLLDREVISESTPLLEALELLLEYPHIFIKERRHVTRVVSRADLDTLPVRIWLYGMISIFEVELRRTIKRLVADWHQFITQEALQGINDRFYEKKSRNEEVEMLDCTYLIQLSSITLKQWNYFEAFFSVKSKAEFNSKIVKLNTLRNELSHSQKVTLDWSEIFNLMRFIKLFLEKV